MKPLTRLLALATLLTTLLLCSTTYAAPGDHRFEKDIAAFEAQDQQTPAPKGPILFVGDSTFTKWKTIHEDFPEYTVVNRGFGGSTMQDLLYFTDRVVLPYKPRIIVVQEGGNDLHGGRTPEQLLADMKAFVEKVHGVLPEVPILLCSTTPNPARWSEVETRKKANQLVKEYAATQKNVRYVNLFDAFLGADGQPREELFIEDHLHPSHAGYLLRVKLLSPLLGKADREPAR